MSVFQYSCQRWRWQYVSRFRIERAPSHCAVAVLHSIGCSAVTISTRGGLSAQESGGGVGGAASGNGDAFSTEAAFDRLPSRSASSCEEQSSTSARSVPSRPVWASATMPAKSMHAQATLERWCEPRRMIPHLQTRRLEGMRCRPTRWREKCRAAVLQEKASRPLLGQRHIGPKEKVDRLPQQPRNGRSLQAWREGLPDGLGRGQ